MTTRRELIDAVAARYRAAGRNQKKEILDEFVKVTGFHRKHAIRALKKSAKVETPEPRQRARIYDEARGRPLYLVRETHGFTERGEGNGRASWPAAQDQTNAPTGHTPRRPAK